MKTDPAWRSYTSYGYCVNVSSALLGFCGYPLDLPTLCYLLGKGYRLYNPGLMRFVSVDNASPFEEGGINPYCYCGGDPVNRFDSSGRGWLDVLTFKRVKLQASHEVFDTRMLRRFGSEVKVAKLSTAYKVKFNDAPSPDLDATLFGEISLFVKYRSNRNAKRAYLLMVDGSQPIPEARGMFSYDYDTAITFRDRLNYTYSPTRAPAENAHAYRQAHDMHIAKFNEAAREIRRLRDLKSIELSLERR
ncbi:RHS repeat-associated core domain-containing protein [Pseudomonas sp. NFX1]|jgi:RHS repeat-associated protein|uniref:RHS repeat-associated core domain-containing protein n=1 Tax=Pseudomonas sp. NFX1 TaxID=2201355 RepID=UPI003DA6EABF